MRVGASPVDGGLPTRTLTLTQNAPNPFNPRTKISFVLPAAGDATLCVYDVDGRLVRTLMSGHQEAGERTVTWDGDDDRGGRCLLYTSPSPRDGLLSRMPSSA